MAQLTYVSSYPVDGRRLTKEAGTFWESFNTDQSLVNAVLEQLSWFEADAFADIAQIKARSLLSLSGDYVQRTQYNADVQLENNNQGCRITLEDNIRFVGSIEIRGVGLLEHGRDYLISANRLQVSRPLTNGVFPAQLRTVRWISGDLSRFWSELLRIVDHTNDIAPLIRAFMFCVQNRSNETAFLKLISEVFQCPKPATSQTVRRISSLQNRAIVETDSDTLVGPDQSSALVQVGHTISPQQDVFDAVRYWNATEQPPPSWVSSLKIPARYFAPIIGGELEFINSPQPVTTTVVNNRVQASFPITGENRHAAEFFAFVRRRELDLDYSLLSFMAGVPQPTVSQTPAEVNPLLVLWQLWLNYGATVSYVRLEPTVDLLTRIQLLRRVTPPWLTHIVHFEQPVPKALISLC